jgi:hypothetical protein
VLEAAFILLEFPSPSKRIFIGSHSLPPLLGSLYRSFTLSEKNRAKLREILSLLQSDIQDQVRDVDLLEEVLESINQ